MKCICLRAIPAVLAGLLSQSLPGQALFQKAFGGPVDEAATSVLLLQNGDYLFAGATSSFAIGASDIFLMRTDAWGAEIWTRTYGGGLNDIAYSLIELPGSGFMLAGTTASFGAGNEDVLLIRTDTTGNVLWSKTYGGPAADFGFSIAEAINGGFIICGHTASYGSGGDDVYVIRVNASGDTLWTKTFGGANDDWGYSVSETSDSGHIITGATQSFGAGDEDVYAIKLNSMGDTLWTRTFGGSSDDYGFAGLETSDSGFAFAGYLGSFAFGGRAFYLLKTDQSGNLQWTRTYAGNNLDNAYHLLETPDSGFVLLGETQSFGGGGKDIFLVKTAPDGAMLWTKAYGSTQDDSGLSIATTNENGYLLVGTSDGFGNGSEIYIIKTDSLGQSGCNEISPNVVFGSSLTTQGSGAQLASGGVVGIPSLTVQTPQPAENVLCYCDTAIAAFTYVDSSFTVYFSDFSTAATSWKWYFGDGDSSSLQNPVHVFPAGGNYTVCLVVSNACGTDSICSTILITGVKQTMAQDKNDILAYPNPTFGNLTISCSGAIRCTVYNNVGEAVLTTQHKQLNLFGFPSGMYFLKIETAFAVQVRKIILQEERN